MNEEKLNALYEHVKNLQASLEFSNLKIEALITVLKAINRPGLEELYSRSLHDYSRDPQRYSSLALHSVVDRLEVPEKVDH